MKLNKSILIFFICNFFILKICFAQQKNKPIDYRFKGKENGFIDLLSQNIRFPTNSLINNIVGFSISSITITPNGVIEKISIINPVDESIDAEVVRLLKLTDKYWKANDTIKTNQTFYVQTVFIITEMGITPDITSPADNNMFFIEPVLVTAVVTDRNNLPQSNDTIASKCSEMIKLKKYEEALSLLNTLIQRNPFNKDFYNLRIMICRKINGKEQISEDIQKINNFIPGVSLDDLLK